MLRKQAYHVWTSTILKTGKKSIGLRFMLILSLFVISTSTFAGQAEYDDCILEYLKGAKLDVATRAIRQACEENYNPPGLASNKNRAYNNCILEHLIGVESVQAVLEIKAACRRKHK